MIVHIETSYLFAIGLMLLGALGALIADFRQQPNLAGLSVLVGAVSGGIVLILLISIPSVSPVELLNLPRASQISGDAGAPFAFPILAALLALTGRQIMTGMIGMPRLLAACAVTCAAAIGAIMTADLLVAYALATVASVFGLLTIHLHPLAGRSSIRLGARYVLLQFICDTGILASIVFLARGEARLAAACLLIGGVTRLGLFPFHVFMSDLSRLPGLCALTVLTVSQAIGMSLFVRAFVLTAGTDASNALLPLGVWLLIPLGLLSCIAGTLLLHGSPRYRLLLDRAALIDCGHLAVAVGVATAETLGSAILFGIFFLLSRATLLLVADAASERGQQHRRLPNGPAMLPFGLGFGTLAFLPPTAGFVARWLLYSMLLRAGFGWAVAILLLVSFAELAVLIRRVATLDPPGTHFPLGRPLAVALAPLWFPLAAVIVGPVVVVYVLVSPALAVARPFVPWSFGLDVLLNFGSIAVLLVFLCVVLLGLATHFRPQLSVFKKVRALSGHGAVLSIERFARIVAAVGLPSWLISSVSDVLYQIGDLVARPSEQRYFSIAIIGFTLAFTLVALT